MIVYLVPKSPFPAFPSDRLFGALCYAIDELYKAEGKLPDMLERFQSSEPPFQISSTFPFIFYDGTEILHFFPKPIERPQVIEDFAKHLPAAKELKKVQFLDQGTFQRWLEGEMDGMVLLRDLEEYRIDRGFLYPRDTLLDFHKGLQVIPRNAINRLLQTSENIFYFTGELYENMGLFFLVEFADNAYVDIVTAALRFLADRGVGSAISTGKGQFELFKISEETFAFPSTGDRSVLLSRYLPRPAELRVIAGRDDCYYELVTKRGRTRDGRVRKQVRFFTEGSTFPKLEPELRGALVYPAEKLVEYGLAYCAPYTPRGGR